MPSPASTTSRCPVRSFSVEGYAQERDHSQAATHPAKHGNKCRRPTDGTPTTYLWVPSLPATATDAAGTTTGGVGASFTTALSGIETAWSTGRPAQLGDYLPDSGILLLSAGQGARVVPPADFLRLAGDAMTRTTSMHLGRLEPMPGGMLRASGERAYQTKAGTAATTPVSCVLQPRGQRWVIFAADLGPAD